MNGLYHIARFVGCIVSYRLDRIAGSYCIVWVGSYCIVSYRIVSYRIVSYCIVSYHIVSAGSGNIGFYALAGYCLDETGGLDGVLVVGGWDVRTLAPAGTGAPPLALEGWRCAG